MIYRGAPCRLLLFLYPPAIIIVYITIILKKRSVVKPF